MAIVFVLLASRVSVTWAAAEKTEEKPAGETPSTESVQPAPVDTSPSANAEKPQIILDPNQMRINPEDPNSPPVPELTLDAKPEDPSITPGGKGRQYWERFYHPQATARVFSLLNYPYYPGGLAYAPPIQARKTQAAPAEATAEVSPKVDEGTGVSPPSAVTGEAEPGTKPTTTEVTKESKTPDPTEALPVAVEPAETAESSSTDLSESGRSPDHIRKAADLVYQWRCINESEGTVLEVVRSVELTKTSTQIYRTAPELAIEVKRTIGQIGIINGRFDVASHEAFLSLSEEGVDRTVLSRMEKLLADLKTLLENLASRNDQIGVALGLGVFDRRSLYAEYQDRMDYSSLIPAIAAPRDIPARY